MQKPEFEVMYFDKDIIRTSECEAVCSSECGVHQCNAECGSFCKAECGTVYTG